MPDETRVSAEDIRRVSLGVNFPATKEDLLDRARENGASEDVMRSLEDLPEDYFEDLPTVLQMYEE